MFGISLIVLAALLGAGDPPKVVSLDPANGAKDVDAAKTTKLVVTFDHPMSLSGWSFCGGGPNFPKFKGKPKWDSSKKIVVEVELEPDHEYELGLNCPSAQKFKSSQDVPLVPVPWSFHTAAGKSSATKAKKAEAPADPAKQRAENQQSLDALRKLLEGSYSYYDRRVASWDDLFRENTPKILAAATAREWASVVSAMLGATEDIHLHLRLGDETFPGGKRAVDPLYREKLLARYVMIQPVGGTCSRGRTDDGIGYVMIGGWSSASDVDALEQALPGLRDCKALVVDVRPNCGGDELLAQRIAGWFVEGERVYGKDRYRTGPGKDGFGPVVERKIAGNADAERHLAMPVAVLTSRYVMSSNESFVLMMRQAKDCTVVGQRTYGSSGNPKPHELPNGVTIVLPSWQDLRLDGTCFEGEGLAPDVEVAAEPKDFEERDPILERALEILRGKIRTTANDK
jgi:C-terminal processing protease CtpA/Prc